MVAPEHMRELLNQYGTLNAAVKPLLDDPQSAILEIDLASSPPSNDALTL